MLRSTLPLRRAPHRVRWLSGALPRQPKSSYDAVVVGAGHNGLVAAAYLQKAGKAVCVLERRHIVGGAACTEEIFPGFKFSRASYLVSLLRPEIWKDLQLKERGVKLHFRDPHSYTPMLQKDAAGKYSSLLLGRSGDANAKEISKFSKKDATSYAAYERHLEKVVDAIGPLIDSAPPAFGGGGSRRSLAERWATTKALVGAATKIGKDLPLFYDLVTAPAAKTLRRWFESEPLIATLATDSVIGATLSPYDAQSGYVLLHHIMGDLEGAKGAWAYVEGGMGALSNAIASAAESSGADIFTDTPVGEILVSEGRVKGVKLCSGQEILADVVLSNATAKVTYLDLIGSSHLEDSFLRDVRAINYESPVTKINVAVNRLPSFLANPNCVDGVPLPHHQSTIHLNCEDISLIDEAYLACKRGEWSPRPVIEMTIPSAKDPTLAPPGCHVVQLFTMYTPYTLAGGRSWDDRSRSAYADNVFNWIEMYAPGFKESVVGRDVLTPPDLERIFGLTGGNIFHGAMSFDQLYISRPTHSFSGATTPVVGLYMCGSSAHPGGGVMGAPGKLAAAAVLGDTKRLSRTQVRP